MTEVRCPHCDKKVAENLSGALVVFCRGCKRVVKIRREEAPSNLTRRVPSANT